MRKTLVVALVVAAVMAGVVSAQRGGPLTPWGDPDLQGTWSSESELSVPFERNAQYGDRKFLTDTEFAQRQKQTATQLQSDSSEFDVFSADTRNAGAVGSATSPPPHWLERGKTSRRTSLVIDPPDGRIPPTVQGRGRGGRGRGGDAGTFAGLGAFGATPAYAGPQDLSLWERCITRGVPAAIFPTVYNANIRIVQGPGTVAITYEMIHTTRVIPIGPSTSPAAGSTHVGRAIRGYDGDSRGRWDGDTLVVDTTNFSDKTSYRGSGETLHLIERFRRDRDGLHYEVTVDDPQTWTKPWTAAITLEAQPDDSLFEYACHEGNNSMRNILSGARKAEQGK
ncbi:MAG TPA: hypothetical protein VM846_03900 [Vicinamibacterales bacterium]|nr:hypothetical protein [Vicinamibacterales bacterium]